MPWPVHRPRTVDSQRLRVARVNARLSQFGLQGLSGVSWRTISRIENGAENALFVTVRALEEALQVTLAPKDADDACDK